MEYLNFIILGIFTCILGYLIGSLSFWSIFSRLTGPLFTFWTNNTKRPDLNQLPDNIIFIQPYLIKWSEICQNCWLRLKKFCLVISKIRIVSESSQFIKTELSFLTISQVNLFNRHIEIVIRLFKGVFVIEFLNLILELIYIPSVINNSFPQSKLTILLLAGIGLVSGNQFPIWSQFKGSFGISAYLGVMLGLFIAKENNQYLEICLTFLTVYLVTATYSRNHSLAIILACIITPISSLFAFNWFEIFLLTIFSILILVKNWVRLQPQTLKSNTSQSATTNKSELPNENLTESIIAIAIESWRFGKLLNKIMGTMGTKEKNRYESRIQWFQKKVNESLKSAKISVVNLEGQQYDVGMAIKAINIDEFDSSDILIVDQMIEPILMGPDGIIKTGTATLRKVEE